MAIPTIERLMQHVEMVTESGCWIWMGQIGPTGYGRVMVKNPGITEKAGWVNGYAHRVMYEALRGPIPEGLQLDHLCRVRCCVNPAHLEPVTQQENIRRGDLGKIERSRTHCPYGHSYEEHCRRRPNAKRVCRACDRRRHHESWLKNHSEASLNSILV